MITVAWSSLFLFSNMRNRSAHRCNRYNKNVFIINWIWRTAQYPVIYYRITNQDSHQERSLNLLPLSEEAAASGITYVHHEYFEKKIISHFLPFVYTEMLWVVTIFHGREGPTVLHCQWPSPSFIKLENFHPWIKDQMEITQIS